MEALEIRRAGLQGIPETVERVLRPAIADLQHECKDREAPANAASGVRSSSRLAIRVRGYWGLWKTLAICFAGDAVVIAEAMRSPSEPERFSSSSCFSAC